MRILKVTQAYYPFNERGGPAVKVRSLARALKEQGNEVVVLTADLGFGAKEIAAAGVATDPDGWRTDLDGVEVVYFSTRFHYRNLTVNPAALSFCRRRLRDFDIVHVYGLYDTLGPAVGHYCRKFKVPYFEPLGMTRSIDRGFLLKKIWKSLARSYLGQASKWIATSELEGKICGVPGSLPIRYCSDSMGSTSRNSRPFLQSAPSEKKQVSQTMSGSSSS